MHVVEFSRYECSWARVLSRFQGRPPNLVECTQIDKSARFPMEMEGEIRFPGLKTLKNKAFSSISGARMKITSP